MENPGIRFMSNYHHLLQRLTPVKRGSPFIDEAEAKRLCFQKNDFFPQNGRTINDNLNVAQILQLLTAGSNNVPSATFPESGVGFNVSDLSYYKALAAPTRQSESDALGPSGDVFLGIQKLLVTQETQLRELRDRVSELSRLSDLSRITDLSRISDLNRISDLRSQLSTLLPETRQEPRGPQFNNHNNDTSKGTSNPFRFSNTTVRQILQWLVVVNVPLWWLAVLGFFELPLS